MGAAQDRARTKNQLVMACSYRVRECPHPTRTNIRSTDHVDSKLVLFGRPIAALFFNYGGPHPNLDLFFFLKTPDRSSSHLIRWRRLYFWQLNVNMPHCEVSSVQM